MPDLFCVNCGTRLPVTAKFCSGCGSQVVVANSAEAGSTPIQPESGGLAAERLDSRVEVPGVALAESQSTATPVSEVATWTPSLTAFFSNRIAFVLAYLAVIAPTYVLPYVGSNSSLVNAVTVAAGGGLTPFFWMHVTAIYLAVVVAWFRGINTLRPWIVIFPFLAGLFDLLPGFTWIFLAPTILHVCAMVFGVKGEATEARVAKWQLGVSVFGCLFLIAMVFIQVKHQRENVEALFNSKGASNQPKAVPQRSIVAKRADSVSKSYGLPSGWLVSRNGVRQQGQKAQRILSTEQLMDERGVPLAYSTTYSEYHGYFQHRGGSLKPNPAAVLYESPTQEQNVKFRPAPPNEVFRVVDTYSIVRIPSVWIATEKTSLAAAGELGKPNAPPFEVAKGVKVLIVEGTQGECPVFFIQNVGFKTKLCFSENSRLVEQKSETRTSFRLRSASGIEGWTRFYVYGNIEQMDKQITQDWKVDF